MEPVSLVVGGVLVLLGYRLGRLHRRPRPAPKAPTCDCGHPYAMHNPKTRRCNVIIGFLSTPCACLHYVGPVPLEELVGHPELMLPRD